MVGKASDKVPFTVETMRNCLCPRCPVQAKSQCVARLKEKLSEALRASPLKYEAIPGAYCAAGKAACTDLDFSQKCLCFGCPVFSRYHLASGQPVGYYCRDGASV